MNRNLTSSAGPPDPPPAPHDLERAVEQEARDLVAHAERVEHISTDPHLSASGSCSIRLRAALKRLLRSFGFKCVRVVGVDPEDRQQQPGDPRLEH
jgi:hypothetical protein